MKIVSDMVCLSFFPSFSQWLYSCMYQGIEAREQVLKQAREHSLLLENFDRNTVMEVTGPGVWTDAVHAYLATQGYNDWRRFHRLKVSGKPTNWFRCLYVSLFPIWFVFFCVCDAYVFRIGAILSRRSLAPASDRVQPQQLGRQRYLTSRVLRGTSRTWFVEEKRQDIAPERQVTDLFLINKSDEAARAMRSTSPTIHRWHSLMPFLNRCF